MSFDLSKEYIQIMRAWHDGHGLKWPPTNFDSWREREPQEEPCEIKGHEEECSCREDWLGYDPDENIR